MLLKRIKHAFLAKIKLIYCAQKFCRFPLVMLNAQTKKLLVRIEHGKLCRR